MLAEDLDKGIMEAPPLALEDIQLTKSESEVWHECMLHTIMRVIVEQGGHGLERWRQDLEKNQPHSDDIIEVHKTNLHPLPTFEIDEASIIGNIDVTDSIDMELKLDQNDPKYNLLTRINAGDQLTLARQRAIIAIRGGHEDPARAHKGRTFMAGLFHGKMTDIHGLLETHFGKPNSGNRSPGSLAHHNRVLDRIPIVLSSLPAFATARDLVMVSLYARVLHCLLLVSGKASLEDYSKTIDSWNVMQDQHQQSLILTHSISENL